MVLSEAYRICEYEPNKYNNGKCNITEPCERGRNICCAMCDDFEDCSDVCDWINYNFAIKCFQKIELENN